MSQTTRVTALEAASGTPAGYLGERVFVNYPADPGGWVDGGERTYTAGELEQFERDGWVVRRIRVVYKARA